MMKSSLLSFEVFFWSSHIIYLFSSSILLEREHIYRIRFNEKLSVFLPFASITVFRSNFAPCCRTVEDFDRCIHSSRSQGFSVFSSTTSSHAGRTVGLCILVGLQATDSLHMLLTILFAHRIPPSQGFTWRSQVANCNIKSLLFTIYFKNYFACIQKDESWRTSFV